MRIIFKSMLMLFTQNYQKLVHACRNYSLTQLAHFLRFSVDIILLLLFHHNFIIYYAHKGQ